MIKPSYYIAATIALVVCCLPAVSTAQFTPNAAHDGLRNISLIRPPAGSKVAVVVFEDLGCPACAHAHPIETEMARKAHVPLIRHDFPFPSHIWTFQGAVCARYIQNKINPALADQYRNDVFANQRLIAGKDDLQRFTQVWLQRHGQSMPFVMDPDGSLAKAVTADYELGLKINVQYTPTVVIVTDNNYQVVCGTAKGPDDPTQILPVAEAALAQASAPHRKLAPK